MARFWMSVGTMEYTLGRGYSKDGVWFNNPSLCLITETVCCSWFAYRIPQIPVVHVRDGMFQSMPHLLQVGGVMKSLLPADPRPRNVGRWLKNLFSKVDFTNFSWTVFHILFLESLADMPHRVDMAENLQGLTPQTLKLVQWVAYTRYYSLSSKNPSPISFLFWQVTLHLFFDFSTGLRPFRLIPRFPEMATLQRSVIEGLEEVIPVIMQMGGPRNNEVATAFRNAATLIKSGLHDGLTAAMLPNDPLLRRMLIASPFLDPGSLICEYIDVTPIRAKIFGNEASTGSIALPLPVDNARRKREALPTATERMKIICNGGLAVLSSTNSKDAPPCGFEKVALTLIPVSVDSSGGGMSALWNVMKSLNDEIIELCRIKSAILRDDDAYIDMIPHLYYETTTIDSVYVSCHSTDSEGNFCHGGATLSTTVTRVYRDGAVSSSMNSNRSEVRRLCNSYRLDESFPLQILRLHKTVHTVIDAVLAEAGQGGHHSNVFPLLVLMTSTISSMLENEKNNGFDPVRIKLEELLADMVRAMFSCGHSDAFDEFLGIVKGCRASHQLSFLSALYLPPPGIPFLEQLLKALLAFGSSRNLGGVIRRFDFSQWLILDPMPSDEDIDRAIEILLRSFCCVAGASSNLTDYISSSLGTILGNNGLNHLLYFMELAFRFTLPTSRKECSECCLTASVWSAVNQFDWKSLDYDQRTIIIQTIIDGFNAAKQTQNQATLMSRSKELVRPINSILTALQPQPGISREVANMLSERATNLFTFLFACPDMNNLPWSADDKNAENNSREIMRSVFQFIGSCAQRAVDSETSYFLLQNMWQLLTDDESGMLGRTSHQVEFPPPHIQNVLLQVMGSALPWNLWCPQTSDLARIRGIISQGQPRYMIRKELNDAFLAILTSVTRNDAPAAAAMAQSRSFDDILTLTWCLLQSFTHCQNLALCKQLEATFADSVNNMALYRLPMEYLTQVTAWISSLFNERATDNNSGYASPMSYILCLLVSASGIVYPNLTFCACDAVSLTEQCIRDRVNYCVTQVIDALKFIHPPSKSAEQTVARTAIKALLAGMTRIALREEAVAASQDLVTGTGTWANGVFEQMAVPLLVCGLGRLVSESIHEATDGVVRECMTEDLRQGGPANFLRALTRATSFTMPTDAQVPLNPLVSLATAAVDIHFTQSKEWAPLVSAYAVPPERLTEFMNESARIGSVQLLHIIWLICRNGGKFPLELWLTWLDSLEPTLAREKEILYVILIVDAVSAGIPPESADFESTRPSGDYLLQLLERLDCMHNDKANRVARFFHLTGKKPYSEALQLFTSAVSQFVQTSLFTDKAKRTFVRVKPDNPRTPGKDVQKQNHAFVKTATSSAFLKKFSKEAMTQFGEEVTAVIENTICCVRDWPKFVGVLYRALWPSVNILAEVRC